MSDNIESILNAIAKTGLESKEVRILPNNQWGVREAVINEIPDFIDMKPSVVNETSPEFKRLMESLILRLKDTSAKV